MPGIVSTTGLHILQAISGFPADRLFTNGDIVQAVIQSGHSASIETVRIAVNALLAKQLLTTVARNGGRSGCATYRVNQLVFKHHLATALTKLQAAQLTHAKADEVRALRRHGHSSYAEIARRTGLSVAAIAYILHSRGKRKPSPANQSEPLDPPTPHELAWRQFRDSLAIPEATDPWDELGRRHSESFK